MQTHTQNQPTTYYPRVTMQFGIYHLTATYCYSSIPIGYTIYNTSVKDWAQVASFSNRQHAVQFIRQVLGVR